MDENKTNNVNEEKKIPNSVADVMNTKDHTSEFDPQDIQNNKVMAILSYLSILVLVPIFAAKDSPYAKFHANQGIVLCIVNIILSVLASVLAFVPVLPLIIWVVSLVVWVISIIGIVNAVQDKAKELPIVGGFRILK